MMNPSYFFLRKLICFVYKRWLFPTAPVAHTLSISRCCAQNRGQLSSTF